MAEMDPSGGRLRHAPRLGVPLPASPALTIVATSPMARFSLRGGKAALSAPLHAAFGTLLPVELNTVATAGGRAAICLGPDEWLLLAPDEEPAALRAALTETLTGAAVSLVEVSHRQLGLDLQGRLAAQVLSAGCPLDLRAAAFPIGSATRTIFAKSEIILWRKGAQHFHVEVWRSFAAYFVGHLTEALSTASGL